MAREEGGQEDHEEDGEEDRQEDHEEDRKNTAQPDGPHDPQGNLEARRAKKAATPTPASDAEPVQAPRVAPIGVAGGEE